MIGTDVRFKANRYDTVTKGPGAYRHQDGFGVYCLEPEDNALVTSCSQKFFKFHFPSPRGNEEPQDLNDLNRKHLKNKMNTVKKMAASTMAIKPKAFGKKNTMSVVEIPMNRNCETTNFKKKPMNKGKCQIDHSTQAATEI